MNENRESGRMAIITFLDTQMIHSNVCLRSERVYSSVQQDTYYSRYDIEKRIVRDYMPSNTKECITDEGVSGWTYSFYCQYGNKYSMFSYCDGDYYQVMVLEPVVEAKYRSAHTGHIFGDGRICFGTEFNNGRPTLRDAYAKSVLWATGMSSLILTGNFQLSKNNLDDSPELPDPSQLFDFDCWRRYGHFAGDSEQST